MTFDLVIENGLVVDGTGTPGKRADVGIAGTRIVATGDLKAAETGRRLDATGCIVAPGFIDIHNHSDLVLLADGRAESMIRQGVTTQVTGNCGLTPAPVHDAIRDDLRKTMVGADGRSFTPGGPTGEGHPHPRSYGAFPRVFARYVREKGLLTLEEAVHKMTGKPARKLRLDRRGELKEGCFADVVVFDPATIRDRATFEQPHQFAEGVHWVIVDGHIALDRGTLSSQLVGRVLTPAA